MSKHIHSTPQELSALLQSLEQPNVAELQLELITIYRQLSFLWQERERLLQKNQGLEQRDAALREEIRLLEKNHPANKTTKKGARK